MPERQYPSRVKTMPCRDCGTPMVVNIQKQKPPRCIDCGVAAYERATREVAGKSGPAYQRWLAHGGNGEFGRGRASGQPRQRHNTPDQDA